jgi:hypothetical protein
MHVLRDDMSIDMQATATLFLVNVRGGVGKGRGDKGQENAHVITEDNCVHYYRYLVGRLNEWRAGFWGTERK